MTTCFRNFIGINLPFELYQKNDTEANIVYEMIWSPNKFDIPFIQKIANLILEKFPLLTPSRIKDTQRMDGCYH